MLDYKFIIHHNSKQSYEEMLKRNEVNLMIELEDTFSTTAPNIKFNQASFGMYHITRMVMAMQYVAFPLLAQYQMHDCQLHYPSSLQAIFEKHDIILMIEIVDTLSL